MKTRPEPLLWLDSNRGVYIPQHFAKCFIDRASVVDNVSAEAWATLEAGPDHEWYWDAWSGVLDRATVKIDGITYTLHQDGDLWLIPDGMPWNESLEFYAWEDETP